MYYATRPAKFAADGDVATEGKVKEEAVGRYSFEAIQVTRTTSSNPATAYASRCLYVCSFSFISMTGDDDRRNTIMKRAAGLRAALIDGVSR
jgi:hypothetical protein